MPNILSYTTASVVLTDIFSNPTHTVKLQNLFLVYSCGYKKLTLQRFKLLSFSLLNNRAEKCFLVSVLLVMSRSTDLDHSLSSSVTHLHLIQGLGNLREAEGLLHHGPDLVQSRQKKSHRPCFSNIINFKHPVLYLSCIHHLPHFIQSRTTRCKESPAVVNTFDKVLQENKMREIT